MELQPDMEIGVPRPGRDAQGRWVLETEVEQETLWFSSPDRELEPAGEAPIAALLMPSLGSPRRLRSRAPVSAPFLENVDRLLTVVGGWWGYPHVKPHAPVAPAARRPSRGRLLCFGGGVDSTHTLRCARERPDALLFIRGFDISLEDAERLDRAEALTRAVAAAVGVEAVVLTTNLRTHPGHGKANWEHTHGGALAGAAHTLAGSFGQVMVSSAYPFRMSLPWGTHPQLDPLWSSDRLRFSHHGAECFRAEKIGALAHDPIARRYLRVCFEHRTAELNCSRCMKCLRTMIALEQHDVLDEFAVFDPPAPLPELVDSFPRITGVVVPVFERLRAEARDPDLRRALARLIARTRVEQGERPAWWWRRRGRVPARVA